VFGKLAKTRLDTIQSILGLSRQDVMTVDEVAKHLGLSTRAVKRLARSGDLPHLQIQGTRMFLRTTVADYVRWQAGEGPGLTRFRCRAATDATYGFCLEADRAVAEECPKGRLGAVAPGL
jgi:excisionase family DNA binding protein